MIKLLEDKNLAKILMDNASITIGERYNNQEAMNDWVKAYKAIYDYKCQNNSLPTELLL